MSPNKFLTPSIVDEGALAPEHRPWLFKYGPLTFLVVAVIAITVLVVIAITALNGVQQVVNEERCRGDQRDQFFIAVVHASSVPPAEQPQAIREASAIVENIPEVCGFEETED